MFHTISNIDKTTDLQQYIDNRNSDKVIGLRSFTCVVGWYNLKGAGLRLGRVRITIPDGYYSFYLLADYFQTHNVVLTLNKVNGFVTLHASEEVKLSKQLAKMLGFNKRLLPANVDSVSDVSADFSTKQLYIHLKQLNTAQNYFNGAPSNILTVIYTGQHSYGDFIHIKFAHPEFKCLSNGTISELDIKVCDENGVELDNHGHVITSVLEIK